MAWDGLYNYDPETGVHRGYDALAPFLHRNTRDLAPVPPVKAWAELSQVERDRGYDIYGRSVSEPAKTASAPLGTGQAVNAREPEHAAGTGWV